MTQSTSVFPGDEGSSAPLEVLFRPSEKLIRGSRLAEYASFLEKRGLWKSPSDEASWSDKYASLWEFSVSDLESFWASIWDFFAPEGAQRFSSVLDAPELWKARWFQGGKLNYAQLALSHPDGHVAVVARSENRSPERYSFGDLRSMVASLAARLAELGVAKGDFVAAWLPNGPEAIVSALAAASLGAGFTSAAPEMGLQAVMDRFSQVRPKVLIGCDGYRFAGKDFDRRSLLAELAGSLQGLQCLVTADNLGLGFSGMDQELARSGIKQLSWEALVKVDASFDPVEVEADHPLWVLYSSGTTGLPKAIVHRTGGIAMEHLKSLALHLDVKEGDRLAWFTTTGWMMWNFQLSSLLLGATVVCFDGSPTWPDTGALFNFAAEEGLTHLGTSAGYLMACRKAGVRPGESLDLSSLGFLGSTGSPLPPEGFRWVYEAVSEHVWLGSISGGTDVCSAFAISCPWLDVVAGEIQCRALGASLKVLDGNGRPVVNEVGELVLDLPLPSMPLGLVGDEDGSRYRAAYFEEIPGFWRHGDWAMLTERGSVIVLGRSDATLNRGGVRTGTAEIYRLVEAMDEVEETVALDAPGPEPGSSKLVLLVRLREGLMLDEELRARIKARLREGLSPRHVPDEIYQVPDVPRTLTGKKVEVPIRKIFSGARAEQVIDPRSLSNPESLAPIEEIARKR